jgi:leader peptidase (prepilin peptidase)/N-methyltransferase
MLSRLNYRSVHFFAPTYTQGMPSLFAFEILALLLGLLFGSFLNVCISRLPAHQSISKPRSHCPNCQATIRWYDNIPLLSWVILRARCRQCKTPISWRYPAVELAVGLFFWLFGVQLLNVVKLQQYMFETQQTIIQMQQRLHESAHGYSVPSSDFSLSSMLPPVIVLMLGVLILSFLLIGLMVMDWQTHKLPDAFTLTGTGIGFVLICCQAVFLGPHEDEMLLKGRNPLTSPGNVTDRGNVILTGPEHLVLGRLLAIVLAASLILLIRFAYQKLRHREGLGLGDAKLMAMIAAFLGFWPAILALFVGVVLCSAYALTLILRRKATAATRLPLGTFLSIGGLFAAVFGVPLIAWYTSLL